MKFNFRRLAFATLLLSTTSLSVADDGFDSSVGDLPGFGEDAYFADGQPSTVAADLRPGDAGHGDAEHGDAGHGDAGHGDTVGSGFADQHEQVDYVSDDDPSGGGDFAPAGDADAIAQVGGVQHRKVRRAAPRYTPIRFSALRPVERRQTQPVGYVDDFGFAAPACGCEGPCDGGCDSECGPPHKLRICRIIDCNTWATAEALLWFPQARRVPVLIASADPGQDPVLNPGGAPADGVREEFGREIDGGLSGGFRIDYGRWIDQNIGIGGRFWFMGENEESYAGSDLDGDVRSVGRPFFDTTGGENSLLIAFDNGNTELTGDVWAESKLDVLGAEAYARFRLGCSDNHHLDFIGGYSYFSIDDELRIASATTVINGGIDPPGTIRNFDDQFLAENHFHGGQLGFEMTANRGCWMVRSLTKIHLGNMRQSYDISGRSESGPVGGVQQFDIGMLAQEGNIGEYERDVFTFAPEVNFKVGYRFRPNVLLSVGYSFLYWDDVALSGAAVDRAINGPNLGTGISGNRPAFTWSDSSLWVQGIDLGAVIDF